MTDEHKETIRPTDGQARALARSLLRSSRFAALAVLDPATGWPLASRVAMATDIAGHPLILVSALAAHRPALEADARCSLLVGETGKGDPLAHPRMTVTCMATPVPRDAPDHAMVERRFLARNPKSRLYAGFADFAFFRLGPTGASLNGGFGKAFRLAPADLLADPGVAASLEEAEAGAVAHMNEDHRDAISLYARHFGKMSAPADWTIRGIDPHGLDLAAGDQTLRVDFPEPLASVAQMRPTLVAMAKTARAALQDI